MPYLAHIPDIANDDQLDRCGHVLQKKKDLTAAEGHVVLLEYLEEQPLLLARPGMSPAQTVPGLYEIF